MEQSALRTWALSVGEDVKFSFHQITQIWDEKYRREPDEKDDWKSEEEESKDNQEPKEDGNKVEKLTFQVLFYSRWIVILQKKKTGERCDKIEECPAYHHCRAKKKGEKQKYRLEVSHNSIYL